MKGWIFTTQNEPSYETKRLVECFDKEGIECFYVHPNNVDIFISKDNRCSNMSNFNKSILIDVNLDLTEDQIKLTKEQSVLQAVETIRNRLDQFGLSEPNVMLLKTLTVIETPALTIPFLTEENLNRLEAVWRMSNDGLSSSEICKIFNDKKVIRKYSDKPYTVKDIGMMRLKYRKRLERSKELTVTVGKWKVEFLKTNRFNKCAIQNIKYLK